MGTSTAKASSNPDFYTRYDPLPGIKVRPYTLNPKPQTPPSGMPKSIIYAASALHLTGHGLEGHSQPTPANQSEAASGSSGTAKGKCRPGLVSMRQEMRMTTSD